MYAEVIHGGHTISQTKIQDISGLFRTFSGYFQDIGRAKIRTFQDIFKKILQFPGHFRTFAKIQDISGQSRTVATYLPMVCLVFRDVVV